ncbi:MAG: hypothetical protein B7Z72_12555 [Gemmatimonadetes bacterium 21-71-4]|nr:MAG: hypothetical protein B7Z72_12555 [Gemmatimonadetes bacterium 21-71-4]
MAPRGCVRRTLHRGDRYDQATWGVVHRAIEDSPLTESFVDSPFTGIGDAQATVLVAERGEVFADRWYHVPPRRAAVAIVTDDDRADARAIAGRIAGQLFPGP